MNRETSMLPVILVSILFVALVVTLLISVDAHEEVLRLLEWLDAQGIRGPLLFTLLMVVVVVLLLPGVLFTTGAGFVFGVVTGTICVVVGTTVGAAIAFLIARHLFGERARGYLLQHDRLRLVSDELTPHGWKIVLLTRLVPFFPFKLSNYFFGLTGFSLRGFAGGTLIGVIPLSLHNVWLGSIAADLSLAGVRAAGRSPVEWTLYLAGFIATLVLVLYLNRLARHALDRYRGDDMQGGA